MKHQSCSNQVTGISLRDLGCPATGGRRVSSEKPIDQRTVPSVLLAFPRRAAASHQGPGSSGRDVIGLSRRNSQGAVADCACRPFPRLARRQSTVASPAGRCAVPAYPPLAPERIELSVLTGNLVIGAVVLLCVWCFGRSRQIRFRRGAEFASGSPRPGSDWVCGLPPVGSSSDRRPGCCGHSVRSPQRNAGQVLVPHSLGDGSYATRWNAGFDGPISRND